MTMPPYDMSLPQPRVNTGDDIANTIYKWASIKQQRDQLERQKSEDAANAIYRQAQMKNWESEADARVATGTRLNAMHQLEANEKTAKLEQDRFEKLANYTKYIAGLPKEVQQVAYGDLGNWAMENKVVPMGGMIPPKFFMTPNEATGEEEWDTSKFAKYADSTVKSAKSVRDKSGKVETVIANPKYNPSQPPSITNYPAMKVSGEYVDGIFTQFGPPEPTLDPFAVQKEKERHTVALEGIQAKNAASNASKAETYKTDVENKDLQIQVADDGTVSVVDKSGKTVTKIEGSKGTGKTSPSKKNPVADLKDILNPVKPGAGNQPVKEAAPTTYHGKTVKQVGRDSVTGKIVEVVFTDGTKEAYQ